MPVRLAHAAGTETREVDSALLIGQDRPDPGMRALQAATVEVVGCGRLQVEQVRVVGIDPSRGGVVGCRQPQPGRADPLALRRRRRMISHAIGRPQSTRGLRSCAPREAAGPVVVAPRHETVNESS